MAHVSARPPQYGAEPAEGSPIRSSCAFASFFQKPGTGAALWAMGQALASAGYITPTSAIPLPAQPIEAVQALRLFVGAVPAVLLLLSILFAWFWIFLV